MLCTHSSFSNRFTYFAMAFRIRSLTKVGGKGQDAEGAAKCKSTFFDNLLQLDIVVSNFVAQWILIIEILPFL